MTKDNKKKKVKRLELVQFNALDWICIGISVVISVITVFVDHEHPMFYVITSIFMLNCGVMETLLGIKGRRSNYIFALLNAMASICITFVDQFYGNMAINIYYIPLCIVGFLYWGKHRDKNKNVIARKLSSKQILVAILIFIATSIGLNIVLEYLDGNATILDSMATILIIYASILGVLRYREQWLVWIVADILMLIMWIGTNNPAIILTRSFYIAGCVYGFINWRRLIRKG